MTTGMLSANTQRQVSWSTIRPPASGPMTPATAPQAIHAPIAGPRSRSWKAATMIASEAGVSSAAAAPWNARATIRNSIVGASAVAMENTPNRPTPSAKIRRSP